jgi:geranylgeranyl diphosphate synthase, type II
MIATANLLEMIEAELSALSLEKEPLQLYEPIRYILVAGGKRIRPVLTLMACNVFNEEVSAAVKPACALEVFHNFTLLHDDIMDNAPIRRNKPTVHTRWNNNVAILSGDAMCIKAYELLAQANENILPRLLRVFNQTALEVCEGQQYDMDFEATGRVSVEQYLQMIRLKTSVLLAACAKIGAIAGGANENDAEKMYNFGLNLGLAFQLQDDLLDVYGDVALFGKKIGNDIVANKKTFLLISALEQASGDVLNKLQFFLHTTGIDATEKIEAITHIYNQLGIRELTIAKIEAFNNTAVSALESLDVSAVRKQALFGLAAELLKRQY